MAPKGPSCFLRAGLAVRALTVCGSVRLMRACLPWSLFVADLWVEMVRYDVHDPEETLWLRSSTLNVHKRQVAMFVLELSSSLVLVVFLPGNLDDGKIVSQPVIESRVAFRSQPGLTRI